MDKFEYKIRAEEIKELIARGEYVQAAEIADTIDWRRVKSVMMLCTISDLYKINRRYEDAKNMLLLAYERRPGGRTICYSLCELCIKTEEFVQAVSYYKEFVQVAPKDTGRYILQYKLYEAQDVSLEERISVLEELKKRDYREKWAYELAYLYHRVGLATRCVEECDELILWFGEGKYVIKAMELKMLHQPLNAAQQERYDRRFEPAAPFAKVTENEESQEQEPVDSGDGLDGGQILTVPEMESGKDHEAGALQGDTVVYENIRRAVPEQTEVYEEAPAEIADEPEELDIQVKTMDMGQYNTINLQAELAAGLREVLGDEQSKSAAITRSIVAPMLETDSLDYLELQDEDIDENDVDDGIEKIESTEVFFGETGQLDALQPEESGVSEDPENPVEPEDLVEEQEHPVEPENPVEEQEHPVEPENLVEEESPTEPEKDVRDETAEIVMNQLRLEQLGRAEEQVMTAQPPKELAGVLSQESDGQISLVMPVLETVEKQITGQMNIEDVLAEWERLKQESQERREEEVRQRVRQQTGNMFTEFEASVRDGLLEQLESGAVLDDSEDEVEELAEPAEDSEELEAIGESEDTEESAEPVEEETLEELEAEETLEEVEAEEVLEEAEIEETLEEPEAEETLEEAEAEEVPEESEIEETLEELEAEETLEEAEAEEVPEESEIEETLEEPEAEETLEEVEAEEVPEESEIEETLEEPEAEEVREESEVEEVVEERLSGLGEEADATEDLGEVEELEEIQEEPDEIQEEQPSVEREKAKERVLTQEEKELFAPYIQSKSAREQLVKAIDNISLAAYTGNIVITGDEGMDTSTLAKNLIREVQLTDSNFSGKVAKISGQALNNKNVAETLSQLKNGALIIQKASGMNRETADALYKELQQESLGIIVVMEDSKKAVNKLLEENKELASCFTSRMNVEALSNDMLVAFARQYAKGMEYSIDDLGVLALHTRIEELQTIDHAVTVLEVKQIVDEAIHHANRKTLGHFIDILMAKRYDEDDMIILTEKDFV